MAKKTTTTERSSCQIMSHDIQRLAATVVSLSGSEGERAVRGAGVIGPMHNQRMFEVRKSGPAFERRIVDSKSGKVIAPWASVGNLYGVGRQLSRDIARAWGCKTLESERGFDGASHRRKAR